MSNNHITPNQVFPATLIIGPHPENLIASLQNQLGHSSSVNNPDILIINESTGWSIESIRQIKLFFSQKPFSHSTRLCLIYQAENMETPAQNAILKVLEEPGDGNFVVLLTTTPGNLLSTIISRCRPLRLKPEISATSVTPIPPSLQSRLLLSDKLGSDKTTIKAWLISELAGLQQSLVRHPSASTSANIKTLITSIDMINHHVDPRAALDFYLLSFK